MTDSQDEMNRTLRFKTTAEERKIIRDRLNLFTKPLEKKSVSHTLNGMCFDEPVITQGVVNRPTPIGLKLNGGYYETKKYIKRF